MSSQIEKWYFVKDNILYKHTENDGWAFLKKGPQAHDEALMTVEEAKIKCPDTLKKALER